MNYTRFLASLFLGLLVPVSGCSEPATPERLAELALRSENSRQNPDSPYQHVVVSRVESVADWYVAICDWEPQWWGTFDCFEYRDGRIVRHAHGAVEQTEQSIHSVRSYRLPQLAGPAIEVIATTHMGHGDMYLYELRDGGLKLLVQTFVRDGHEDQDLIRGGNLRRQYEDVNDDGALDLVLTGVVDHYDQWNKAAVRSQPCRKVFLWQADKHGFVEDRASREGLETYANRP
ncbi:MAG: hypothetical protein ACYTF6_04900 [Planctomycetota bacterium]|jgi:hypothetical protein